MAKRPRYLIIAVLLTMLDAVVTVREGAAIWREWSADIWACGVQVLFAALGVISLANVWAHALGSACGIDRDAVGFAPNTPPVDAAAQGEADV